MTHPPDRKPMPDNRGQRRYLTILFASLSDSARLAAAMEAEDYAELLAAVWRSCEQAIPKHGGTLVQIFGDGILVSFGYPDAREDDGRRATETALDLHELVRRLKPGVPLPAGTPLRLHTGIHSGLVLLDEGDQLAGRIRLFGNATNVAARLSQAAGRDEILVSRETLGAESHFFQTDDGRALKLQGMADPITVYRIIGRAQVGTRFEARTKRGLTPFAGRKAELHRLAERLRETLAGEPRQTAIVAPAGSGKTRLAEEFLARAAGLGCQIHRGYCESYLSAEPLQPFLQILRSLCGLTYRMSPAQAAETLQQRLIEIDPALVRDRPALLRALSLSAAPASGGEARPPAPDNIAAAICRLIAALAGAGPLVLFIDDWQWADDAARQVFGAIRQLEGKAIFLLVAAREMAPGEVGLGDAARLDLMPLSAEETEQTIVALLPGRSKFVTAEIRDYSGGNPLFVEELCHAAAHDAAERRSGRGPSGKAWLDKLIEARVERLPAEQIDLVRTAAVVGNVVPVRVLEAITGYGADHPILATLTDQDLIYPGEQPGTLRFKHGIARDVIYDAVGLRQRKILHLQIAEAFKLLASSGHEEELYEPLAYHYAAGGAAAEAAHYAELAGDKAMAASALDRAQVQYLAALEAIDLQAPSDGSYKRWMAIAQRLALACVFDPSRERLSVLRRAAGMGAAHGDVRGTAYAEYWVGYIYYALGESRQAIGHLELALAGAMTVEDAPLATQIRATLGQARAAAGDYDEAVSLLDEAIGIKRQHRRSSRPAVGLAYSLACKASVMGDRGRFDDAYQCLDEALAAVSGADHEVEASVRCWRSAVSLWQGRWEDARTSAVEAQRVAERVKSLYLYAMSVSLGAFAAWKVQGDAGALQSLVDATSWLEKRDRGLFVSLNYGWLAECMATARDWRKARRHAAGALVRTRRHDRIGEAMACRAMARASAMGQCRKPAEFYLALGMANALARQSQHEIAVTRLCEAEIRAARGQRIEAAALLDQAEPAFSAMAMSWHLDTARHLRRDL